VTTSIRRQTGTDVQHIKANQIRFIEQQRLESLSQLAKTYKNDQSDRRYIYTLFTANVKTL